jgi:hypothetical protein
MQTENVSKKLKMRRADRANKERRQLISNTFHEELLLLPAATIFLRLFQRPVLSIDHHYSNSTCMRSFLLLLFSCVLYREVGSIDHHDSSNSSYNDRLVNALHIYRTASYRFCNHQWFCFCKFIVHITLPRIHSLSTYPLHLLLSLSLSLTSSLSSCRCSLPLYL